MFYYLKTHCVIKITKIVLLQEGDPGFLTIVYHNSFNHEYGICDENKHIFFILKLIFF